jgi:hypothetical protein
MSFVPDEPRRDDVDLSEDRVSWIDGALLGTLLLLLTWLGTLTCPGLDPDAEVKDMARVGASYSREIAAR